MVRAPECFRVALLQFLGEIRRGFPDIMPFSLETLTPQHPAKQTGERTDERELQLSCLNRLSSFRSMAAGRPVTLHLDAAVSTGELASGAVADALLDGAGARPAAVRRRSDDPPSAPTSAETAARTAR